VAGIERRILPHVESILVTNTNPKTMFLVSNLNVYKYITLCLPTANITLSVLAIGKVEN